MIKMLVTLKDCLCSEDKHREVSAEYEALKREGEEQAKRAAEDLKRAREQLAEERVRVRCSMFNVNMA